MCIPNQCVPLLTRNLQQVRPKLNVVCRSVAPVDEGPGIARVVQYVDDARVIDPTPEHLALANAALQASREAHALALEAAHDRTGRARLAIGVEEKLQCAVDLGIRIERDGAVGCIDQPHR